MKTFENGLLAKDLLIEFVHDVKIESESVIVTEPEAEPEPESEPEVEPESAAFGVEPFGPYSVVGRFGRGFGGFAEPEHEIWG